MSLFSVMSDIKQLTPEKQQAFESFYKECMNKKLRPVTADFTLVIIWLNSLVNIYSQVTPDIGWASVHPLAYLYCASITFLWFVNKYTTIRQRAPLIIYVLLITMMVFANRDFVIERGWVDPVMGLYFFLAFIGYVTASIRHTLILLVLHLLFISSAHALVYTAGEWPTKMTELLSSSFVFSCTLSALTSAVFVNWIFRNLFAMQFLLNDKNSALSSTLITLKTTEEQLIQQQKYQALNHMAKGLLHEIINPVNSSSQALSFAKSLNKDEDIGEAIDEAMAQQKRISDIVTDLRSFAQPEVNQQVETADLEVLINKALKFCHRELKKTNVEVELQVADELYIDCQPSALIQVFVNVLLNSCDALKHKQETLARKITISSQEKPEGILIRFKDNGVGITPTVLGKITDPFVSGNSSSKNLGLGLSICQTIIRHHGGSIKINSRQNEWTEVSLLLPARIEVTELQDKKHNSGALSVNVSRSETK